MTSGTILMDQAAARPDCFQREGDVCPEHWMAVRHGLAPRELDIALSAGGWTFFYMGNTIQATVFGFDSQNTLRTALTRIITAAKEQHCNCLEVDEVRPHSFLWLPWLTVSAHPRHIQKGMVFAGGAATDFAKSLVAID